MIGTKGLRNPGLTALDYIRRNPGCCTAEVDRACRTARGGHKWMYATVGRLIKRKLVRTVPAGNRANLFAIDCRFTFDIIPIGCIFNVVRRSTNDHRDHQSERQQPNRLR